MRQGEKVYYPELENYVRLKLRHTFCGHDFLHADRVRVLSRKIFEKECAYFSEEQAEMLEVLALCHDLLDRKVNVCSAAELLAVLRMFKVFEDGKRDAEAIATKRNELLYRCSHFGSGVKLGGIVEQCVKDADYLDAMGAIGVARAFAFGGAKGLPYYAPQEVPGEYYSGKDSASILIHFQEKLFTLRDRMYTATARQMAEGRQKFLLEFYEQFMQENAEVYFNGEREKTLNLTFASAKVVLDMVESPPEPNEALIRAMKKRSNLTQP